MRPARGAPAGNVERGNTAMSVKEYVKPRSVGEALDLLASREGAVVLGGGAYLRLADRPVELAIDLCDVGLDYIREGEGGLEIGAMTTYRRLETSEELRGVCGGMIGRSVAEIAGVQLRNVVTVGGTVYRSYAFSNLVTALLAAGADVELGRAGRMPLAEYLDRPRDPRDILAAVVLPRPGGRGAYADITNSRNDFAILNAAVAAFGDEIRIAVGARPGVARLATDAAAWLAANPGAADAAGQAGEIAAAELDFGDNLRASAEYRRRVCPALVRRAIEEALS